MGLMTGMKEFLFAVYEHAITDKSSFMSGMQTSKAHAGLTHPMKPHPDGGFVPDFHSRYLTEDLPHGLVAMCGVAELVNVPAPMLHRVLQWGQEVIGHQYLVEGKIAGKDVAISGAPQRFGYTEAELMALYKL